jgi:hypothetical protein
MNLKVAACHSWRYARTRDEQDEKLPRVRELKNWAATARLLAAAPCWCLRDILGKARQALRASRAFLLLAPEPAWQAGAIMLRC